MIRHRHAGDLGARTALPGRLGLAGCLLLHLAGAPAVEANDRDCTPSEIEVASIEALQDALDHACAGTSIEIEPGDYRGAVRAGANVRGTAALPIVVAAARGLGSVTIDGDGADVTWKFSGSRHVEMRHLEITGGGHHGIFLERGAANILIEGNRIFDNHARRPLDSHAEVKGSGGHGRPRDVTIRGNEIFHTTHPPGGNFQGIDCNFCSGFRIVGNHIHDIREPTSQPYSFYDRGSCIQMKSKSRDTLIDRNLIERCHIGIVLGGEGLESPENVAGTVRNNVILDSARIGLAVVNARDAEVVFNTILGPAESVRLGRDHRFTGTRNTGLLAMNVLSNPPSGRGQAGMRVQDNVLVPGVGTGAMFAGPRGGELRLQPSIVDRLARPAQGTPCPAYDFHMRERGCGESTTAGALAP